MRWLTAATMTVAMIGLPATARAEVLSSGPNGFEIQHSVSTVAPQQATFDAFARVADWWNADHTYSGKSSNLSLELRPGGCFCERLDGGGGVEHMRVAFIAPGERLVLTGGLGPLLFEATAGVMDVKVERTAGGSRLIVNYRSAGFARGGADKLAPIVDRVLGDQVARFRKYAAAMPRSP
jgi:uncharacterized protein YndB with AHSA1/START domain